MLKNVKIILVTVLLIVYTSIGVYADEDIPQSSAKSAILMDINGRILYEKNIHERMPMASTTKIMTAIVALEYGRLDDKITIPPEASGIEGSSIWLSSGETHTLEDLLYGLMLRSGNDAAIAIALHIGGTVEEFTDMMNSMARKIGAYNTHFVNPHGLHHNDHYTTAYDLALITAYGLKNPDFETIVSTKYHTIPWEGHDWDRAMKNKNKLLWSFDGANGVKTGYTKKAGRCFVGSAKRDNLQLIAVVLNCGPMFEESAALLNYGFKNYRNYELIEKGSVIKTLPVKDGRQENVDLIADNEYNIALQEEELEKIRTEVIVPDELQAPVEAGKAVGSVKIYLNDNYIGEVPVVTGQSVEKRSIWDFFRRMVNIWR